MRAALVSIARGWIGTPYHHQACLRGVGCDCLGLIRGVWAEATGTPLLDVPPYTPDWSEPQGQETLAAGLAARLVQTPPEAARPGDVLLFRMRHGAVSKHLGLMTEAGPRPRFIHAYQGHGVIEADLSPPWRRRLVAAFAFPVSNQEE
ncbi:NlpC/P60 family protein [Salibaculum griseiflavum]|uniref:Peptidase n=1 Tax=Salibaculum griseiflavum TaxID=1914409 RepID=A0A2V1P715_9RHOB|nr:NlpC/P60 family protein [Salibaculum griseiflavum]PWG18265.1 peptidase [Salibaculum griseiflavum]